MWRSGGGGSQRVGTQYQKTYVQVSALTVPCFRTLDKMLYITILFLFGDMREEASGFRSLKIYDSKCHDLSRKAEGQVPEAEMTGENLFEFSQTSLKDV